MKGFLALLLLAVLALGAYNMYEVRQLRQEVERLNVKLQEQQSAGSVTDQAVAQAVRAIASAKDAVSNTDWNSARSRLDAAAQTLQQAARTASDKAAPTVRWLEQQATDLNKQVQDRIHGH